MNERIKELAGQAKVMAEESINMKISATNEELYAFAEEFSELIVQECLDILDDEDTGDVYGKSVRLAMTRIKQHFGVWE